jgi:hypothetical protein
VQTICYQQNLLIPLMLLTLRASHWQRRVNDLEMSLKPERQIHAVLMSLIWVTKIANVSWRTQKSLVHQNVGPRDWEWTIWCKKKCGITPDTILLNALTRDIADSPSCVVVLSPVHSQGSCQRPQKGKRTNCHPPNHFDLTLGDQTSKLSRRRIMKKSSLNFITFYGWRFQMFNDDFTTWVSFSV